MPKSSVIRVFIFPTLLSSRSDSPQPLASRDLELVEATTDTPRLAEGAASPEAEHRIQVGDAPHPARKRPSTATPLRRGIPWC